MKGTFIALTEAPWHLVNKELQVLSSQLMALYLFTIRRELMEYGLRNDKYPFASTSLAKASQRT